MTNLKKVFLTITVVVLLIVACATVVKATTGDIQVITGTNTEQPSPNDILNSTNNRTNNNITNTNTNTNRNTNSSTYNNASNLPKTGAEDYTLTLIIGALAVVAIVTYRRIRFYKDI